ncbi:hypothetical protein [Desulfobacula sp.]|uniref:hypothetical protein n=1 Tax=Desulfobacula sp. TaxID=2593537 RepID=UPI0025C2479C|nr:hypothetical protein [Desulfobacula sp.]MBC2703981.1 hypothetical protein [Desulfobacula sp.]
MKGFTQIVRNKIKEIGEKGTEIKAAQLAEALNLTSRKDKNPLYRTIQDFVVRGEVKRLRHGVYKYVELPSKNELKSIMWRLLRARKIITIDDLEQLSGASREYVTEWLRMLEKRKIVKRLEDGRCRLINDTVIEPKDNDKAFKYRKIRRKKKREALTALDQASAAIKTAKEALQALDAGNS